MNKIKKFYGNIKIKTIVILLLLTVAVSLLMYTDPNSGKITQLKYGATIFQISYFISLSIMGIGLLELIGDPLLDSSYGTEDENKIEFVNDPYLCISTYISRAIRILAHMGVIITAMVLSFG